MRLLQSRTRNIHEKRTKVVYFSSARAHGAEKMPLRHPDVLDRGRLCLPALDEAEHGLGEESGLGWGRSDRRPEPRQSTGEMSEWLKEHAWKACVRVTVPRVRIPLSPPTGPDPPRGSCWRVGSSRLHPYGLAVLGGELAVPCNLQSAPAGLNPPSKGPGAPCQPAPPIPVSQPCAMSHRQPRQARKGAAVRGRAHVPQVSWEVGGGRPDCRQPAPRRGARPTFFFRPIHARRPSSRATAARSLP